MKKLLALLLVLAMLFSFATIFTACGEDESYSEDEEDEEDEDEEETKDEDKDEGEDKDDEDKEPADDDESKGDDEDKEPAGDDDEKETKPQGTKPPVNDETEPPEEDTKPQGGVEAPTGIPSVYTVYESMDEAVFDNDYVTVTIDSIESNSYMGVGVNVTVTNNTDEDLTVYLYCAANGYGCSSCFSWPSAGASEEETIWLYDYSDVEDVTGLFLLCEVQNSEYELTVEELAAVFPDGSDAYRPETVSGKAETTIFDDDFSMVITGCEEGEEYGDECLLVNYIAANNSDIPVSYELNVLSVNALGWSGYSYDVLLPGVVIQEHVALYLDELAAVDITDITSLDIRANYHPLNDWTYTDEATITLYPNGESAAKDFVFTPDSNDQIVVENKDFRLYFLGTYNEGEYDQGLSFFLERLGEDVTVDASIMSINGVEADEEMGDYCWIYQSTDGYSFFSNEYLTSEKLEVANIGSVDEIENFTLLIEVRDVNYDVVIEGLEVEITVK